MIQPKLLGLNHISIYRTELMGIAILCIMFYHTKINFGGSLYLVPFRTMKAIGYGGVDLFFFLSGFGIVCGWLKKKYSIPEFYKRRLSRIVPTYWLWMLLYGLLNLIVFKDFKIKGFIADFFGIGFLSSRSYNNWFIPAIIICYLIFPWIVSFLIKRGERYWASKNLLCIFFYASLPTVVISLILILIHANQLLILSSRLPNFILGILIGLACFKYKAQTLEDLRISIFSLILLIAVGLVSLYMTIALSTEAINFKYGFCWYPFILLAFPLCLLLGSGIAWLKDKYPKNTTFLLSIEFLCFCGNYSLEIYLMHSLLFAEPSLLLVSLFNSSELLMLINTGRVFSYVLLAAVSLITAYLLGQIVRCSSYLLTKHLFAT